MSTPILAGLTLATFFIYCFALGFVYVHVMAFFLKLYWRALVAVNRFMLRNVLTPCLQSIAQVRR